jgi:hypothetical protein
VFFHGAFELALGLLALVPLEADAADNASNGGGHPHRVVLDARAGTQANGSPERGMTVGGELGHIDRSRLPRQLTLFGGVGIPTLSKPDSYSR